jgi:phage-related protein
MCAGIWEDIKNIFGGAFTIIGGAILLFWNNIKLYFSTAWTALKGIVSIGWDLVVGLFKANIAIVTGAINGGLAIWNMGFDGFASAFKNTMSSVWETVKFMFANGINWVIDKINSAIDGLNSAA